ncbi:MAG: V-type ATP synthase subunit I [Caldiserica bacterium]|nr:V-type ATP synthase subunit I [Caldisericota bacterium]
MAVVKLKKIGILGLKEKLEHILSLLQKEEAFHIIDPELTEDTSILNTFFSPAFSPRKVEVEEALHTIDAALKNLDSLQEERGLFEGLLPEKILVEEKEIEGIFEEFDYKAVCKDIEKTRFTLQKIEERMTSIHQEIHSLLPFQELPFSFNEIKKTISLPLKFIRIKEKNREEWETLLQSLPETHLEKIGKSQEENFYILFYLPSREEEIDEIIKEHNIEDFTPPDLDELPAQRIKALNKEKETLLRKKQEIRDEVKVYLAKERNLKIAYDYYYLLYQKELAYEESRESKYTFILEGWVPEAEYRQLTRWLGRNFPETACIELPMEEEENVPIKLKNHSIFRPFETITKLYTLPRYGEVDPSPLLAPFFAFFFGLCLTDAGYGVILVLVSLFLMKKLTVGKDMLKVILIGGITTIFWGIITGGWFGIEPESLPRFLQKLIVFNPLKDLMTLFVLSLALGMIHILFGIGIEFYEKLRKKMWLEALGAELSWLVILPGLIMYYLFQKTSPLLSKTGIYMLLGGFAISFLPCFKKGQNPLLKMLAIIGGFMWKGKDLLGNILSYSRLMALGLATSVIALVVNTLAGITSSIPLVGIGASIIVLIGGHIFNLTINTLGAFVHTSRLQFVEFFPYFFEGGGKEFHPLSREGKYTLIITRR